MMVMEVRQRLTSEGDGQKCRCPRQGSTRKGKRGRIGSYRRCRRSTRWSAVLSIDSGWQDAHLAHIIIVRKIPGGFTVVGFLVDTWGLGLKDAFLRKGLSRMELGQLLAHATSGDEFVDCPLPLAQELVYGGLAWARRHGFRPPAEAIRSLKILPAPPGEPDIARFGTEDGRPLIIGPLKR